MVCNQSIITKRLITDYNKEADNGLQETFTGSVVYWLTFDQLNNAEGGMNLRASDHSKEEHKGL